MDEATKELADNEGSTNNGLQDWKCLGDAPRDIRETQAARRASTEIPNDVWLLSAIESAMTLERLELLSHEIKMDKEAGVDYTKDTLSMGVIRQAWARRMEQLKKGK